MNPGEFPDHYARARARAGAKTASSAPRRRGRPTLLTPKLMDVICALIGEGNSLRSICRRAGMPARSTVMMWLKALPSFQRLYALAHQDQAHILAEEALEIIDAPTPFVTTKYGRYTDPAAVERARVRAWNRIWLCSKLLPKKYR